MIGLRGCGGPGREARRRGALLVVAAAVALALPAIAPAGDAVSQPVGPGAAGSVSVSPDGAPAPATVSWSASTFAEQGTLTVDPRPVASTPGFLAGSGNQLLAVEVTDSQGAAVATVAGQLAIAFALPAGVSTLDHWPAVSLDGSTFEGVPECSGGALGGSQDDCFRVASDVVHVRTRRPGVFGVVANENVDRGDSGRSLKPVRSGAFGDISLVHAGPANVGVSGAIHVFPFSDRSGRAVELGLTVDEQVSAYVSVEAGSTRLPILLDGTMVGGTTRLARATVKTLHVTILRPGTLRIRLRVPAASLMPGRSYRLRLVTLDFDGNRTVKLVAFRG